jgi:hypothetical protein
MKKILLIGHARHGKDTVAAMMKDIFGYEFESSSEAAAKIFLYEALKQKYGYKTYKECFEDRVNHRAEWHDAICEYNKDDKARLAKDILEFSNMYVGMRCPQELAECRRQKLFDYVIGVYDPRKPLESASSFSIDLFEQSDFIIPNAEGLNELYNRVLGLAPILNSNILESTTANFQDQ